MVLEMLVNPKNRERGAIKMFFIGILYASLSLILVHWFFSGDPVLSQASGMIVIAFCIMFSLPFMYFLIKQEEVEDEQIEGFFGIWSRHSDAIWAFLWLFLGFVLAFSFWNIVLQNPDLLDFQLETYCTINSPQNVEQCVAEKGFPNQDPFKATGSTISGQSIGFNRFLSILENNFLVMIFTLIFSLIFGAGAIFVLAWNASVIAAAIGVFSKYQLSMIPLGIVRYMFHGFLEIAAYFVVALAGGIFGVGLLRHGLKDKKILMRILENTILLIALSIVILIIAALVEVYITPLIPFVN